MELMPEDARPYLRRMNPDSMHACYFWGSGEMETLGGMDAQGTHEAAVNLLLGHMSTYDRRMPEEERSIFLSAYTFDLQILADALVYAVQNGNSVRVAVDKGRYQASVRGGGTLDMADRLNALRGTGVQIRTLNGISGRYIACLLYTSPSPRDS